MSNKLCNNRFARAIKYIDQRDTENDNENTREMCVPRMRFPTPVFKYGLIFVRLFIMSVFAAKLCSALCGDKELH
jgi:hypothetical protein